MSQEEMAEKCLKLVQVMVFGQTNDIEIRITLEKIAELLTSPEWVKEWLKKNS